MKFSCNKKVLLYINDKLEDYALLHYAPHSPMCTAPDPRPGNWGLGLTDRDIFRKEITGTPQHPSAPT